MSFSNVKYISFQNTMGNIVPHYWDVYDTLTGDIFIRFTQIHPEVDPYVEMIQNNLIKQNHLYNVDESDLMFIKIKSIIQNIQSKCGDVCLIDNSTIGVYKVTLPNIVELITYIPSDVKDKVTINRHIQSIERNEKINNIISK